MTSIYMCYLFMARTCHKISLGYLISTVMSHIIQSDIIHYS